MSVAPPSRNQLRRNRFFLPAHEEENQSENFHLLDRSMSSVQNPYAAGVHRVPSARTSSLEVSPLRNTSRTAGGGASILSNNSIRRDSSKMTMSLDRAPSRQHSAKVKSSYYDEEKKSPYLSTTPYNSTRRSYLGTGYTASPGTPSRQAPPTPSNPIRTPSSVYESGGSSASSLNSTPFSVLKKYPSSAENSFSLDTGPSTFSPAAKELFPQKREKSAPLKRYNTGSKNEERTLYHFSRPNTATVIGSKGGVATGTSSTRGNSRSLLSSLSPNTGSNPRANSAQIRSLEQRIREREAQLRSSSSASLLGGLRRHSAQQRETPSPSGSTQYLGSGTSPSSTAPSPSGSSLPASAVRPYARGLQDLVNSTRNMPSISSAREDRYDRLSAREGGYTPRSARGESSTSFSALASQKLAEYEDLSTASLERHVCFRPNALPRGTMIITPAGERGEDKWSTLNRVIPDKLVVSMEEKTVQREVEAYFVLKHNHSENVLQTMFENMSRSGTTTKVLCLHLREGFAMYILPQENYPVEGQTSPKCFLGALVRMRLMLVWDLDNTLVDCLEAPDSKPGALNSFMKKSKGSDIMTIQVRDELGHYAYSVLCKIRPGAVDTLVTLSRKYEMIICTMGMRSYAEAVVHAALDPEGRLFSRIIAREDLDPHPSMYGMFVKDLHKLCRLGVDADPRRSVIVDDSPDVWKQEENVLPVMRYLHFSHPDSCANGYTTSLAAARVQLERLEKRFHESPEPWNTNVSSLLSEIRRS